MIYHIVPKDRDILKIQIQKTLPNKSQIITMRIIKNSKGIITLIKILHRIYHLEIHMEIYQIILECNKGVRLVDKTFNRLEVN